jgi:2-phospho-L-lactate guanylyltransferase (CobY/MobA/RfbA family)
MIDIRGKTMLQWVVDALRGSKYVGRITAVGDVSAEGLDMVVPPGESLVDNIKLGIDSLGAMRHALIVSSDIPLLTPEAVDDFVERAINLDVGLAYPILTKASSEAKYPGMTRTYLTTADGVFTGGNIMLVSPEFIEKNWEAVQSAYAARKQVFRLARMIGLGVLLRVIAARFVPSVLRVSMLEQAVSRMLGAKVAAVVSDYPEIGEDVDKPSDLEAVRGIMTEIGC